MACDVLHPRSGAANLSEFGRIAVAIDEAEHRSGETIGGPSCLTTARLREREDALQSTRPLTADDFHWLARRLARAIENGWHCGAVKPLLRLAM